MNTVDIIKKRYGDITMSGAIKAWSKGYDINCYVEKHGYTYTFQGKDLMLQDSFYNTGITKDMVSEGVWYIKS